MATKDSIMKQSIFFWVFGHRLSFEYGLKKFLFGAWRNLSGALRELILSKRKKYKLPEQNKLNKTACLKNALYVKGIFQYTSLMTSVCMRYVGAMEASSYLS